MQPIGALKSSSRAVAAGSGVVVGLAGSRSVDALSSQRTGGAAISASVPNSSPPLRAMREPVRIASVSPSRYDLGMQAASANGSTAQQPQRSPLAVSLAPPTERTRLLLDGFSLQNDEVDALDLVEERAAFAGPSSYGSRNQSGSSSPSALMSPRTPVDKMADAHSSQNSRAFLAFILPVTVILCVGNSVTWKRTLNRFASVDGSQRNLGFFVNEWTLVLYTLIAGAFLAYRWLFTNSITFVATPIACSSSWLDLHPRILPFLIVSVPLFVFRFSSLFAAVLRCVRIRRAALRSWAAWTPLPVCSPSLAAL